MGRVHGRFLMSGLKSGRSIMIRVPVSPGNDRTEVPNLTHAACNRIQVRLG